MRRLHLGEQVGPVRVRLQHRRVLVAEHELDLPVLPALEAAARRERGPDRRVLGRRHRREHVPGVDHLLHDLADAGEHLEGALELVARDRADGGAQLVQEQLHPELGHLVLDDEQHLVVRAGAQVLRAEQLVEMEVVAVAHLAAEVDLRRFAGDDLGRRRRRRACVLHRHVTLPRRAKRSSRQAPLSSTSCSCSAASHAST